MCGNVYSLSSQRPSGPMGLDTLLNNSDKSNYIVICEMHQISPKRTHFEFWSKAPHVCFTSATESPFSPRLILRPAILELYAILIQVHQMTPNLAGTIKGQRFPIYMLQKTRVKPSHRFGLRTSVFALQATLRQVN